jgi:hypothetical protein
MYDPGLLYVDPIPTNFSVGFTDQALYGERIFPVTPVNTQSGRYRVFDRSNWLIFESRRAPGTAANEILGQKWSEDTFETRERSLQVPILDEERQALDSQGGLANPVFGGALQINPELDATTLATRSLLLAHELAVSGLVRNTATYPVGNTVTLTGAAQWDNLTGGTYPYVTSNPLNDIMTGIRAVYAATNRYPNTMIVPALGMNYLENHPRIVDRFKNFSLSIPDAFMALTGFQGQILATDSHYNAAQNIDAAQSIQPFWGKDVWLGIVDPNPSLNQFTFGKTFAQNYPDGSTRPVDRWREESRKADIIRVSYKYDLKVVSSGAGYLIQNAFSSSAWGNY